MSLRINDTAPDFTAETTHGTIHFHEWIGDGWAILFSHPKDFTPVCTTELGSVASLEQEFKKRNTKVIGLSVDPVSSHGKWALDIEETGGYKVNYPMIGDTELKVAKLYDMLPADSGDTSEGRTAATNATVRTVFIIGPDKKIKLHLSYPMTTGRNFPELLRVIDSMQLTARHKVATPADWKQGDDVIILPSVSDEEAKRSMPAAGNHPSLIFVSFPSRSSLAAECMQRIAFLLRLRPGTEEAYDKAHESWPEMLALLKRAGISEYSIFRRDQLLVLSMHVDNFEETWARIEADPVNTRWQQAMAPYFAPLIPCAPGNAFLCCGKFSICPSAKSAGELIEKKMQRLPQQLLVTLLRSHHL